MRAIGQKLTLRWQNPRENSKNVKNLDVNQLKERLKELLKGKIMSGKSDKKYTVSDVYQEAAKMLKEEMQGLKKRALTPSEEIKMKELGRSLSKLVLKEMKLV